MKYSIKKNPYSFLEVSPKPSEKFLKEIYSKNISKTNYLHAIAGFIALMNYRIE